MHSFFCAVLCILIFVFFSGNSIAKEYLLSEGLTPPEITRRSIEVTPLVYNAKENRRILTATTPNKDGSHEDELTVTLEVDGVKYIIDLRLNRELIPVKHTVFYQKEGKMVQHTPVQELCHYLGEVRNMKNSRVALSTCNGLNGLIFYGNSTKSIEAGEDGNLESEHMLHYYEQQTAEMPSLYEDIVDNDLDIGVGYNKKYENNFGEDMETKFSRIMRYKTSRSEKNTVYPYGSNIRSRYIEMSMVVDQGLFTLLGSKEAAYDRCKDIANIVNMLYSPLNIFITLVNVEIWTRRNEITLSDNIAVTRKRFNNYLREKGGEKNYDFSQLLTIQVFSGGALGQAMIRGLCSINASGAVASDDAGLVSGVATAVAHELGHNIGLNHDSEGCLCPDPVCIMFPSLLSYIPVHWSSCSYQYLIKAFQQGMDYCLRNKPILLFEPNCGNGIVETGEQCDCGLEKSDSLGACDSCCDTDRCVWRDNATCASGQCCDLKTCQPAHAGTVCRTADHECDLPEYCTGKSEFCPDDIFKMDTELCNHGKSFCYRGTCPQSRSEQCRMLWGPSGTSALGPCYQKNTKGSEFANCGYDMSRQSYVPCAAADVYCGRLQCDTLQDHIELGILGSEDNYDTYINEKYEQSTCARVKLDLRGSNMDPGLVHDGAVCGDDKICVEQKCLAVDSVRVAPRVAGPDCSGRGVRNSLGHCHCDVGFGSSNCEQLGPGGSEDSGPASPPSDNQVFVLVVYAMFALITLTIILPLFLRIFEIDVYRRCRYTQCNAPPTEYPIAAANAINISEQAANINKVYEAANEYCKSSSDNVAANECSNTNVVVNEYCDLAVNKYDHVNLAVNRYFNGNVAANVSGKVALNKYENVNSVVNKCGNINVVENKYSYLNNTGNRNVNVVVNSNSSVQ